MPGFAKTRNTSNLGPYEIDFGDGLEVELYNFNGRYVSEFLDARSDWLGGSHLNQRGAEKFTKILRKEIAAVALPDNTR